MEARDIHALVREAGGFHDDHEAARTLRQVLRALGRTLPSGLCGRVAGQLPAELAVELEGAQGPDPLIERQAFIGPLVNLMETEYGYDESLGGLDLSSAYADDDASRWVRAAFTGLRAALDGTTRLEVERHLPDEIADWWRDAELGDPTWTPG